MTETEQRNKALVSKRSTHCSTSGITLLRKVSGHLTTYSTALTSHQDAMACSNSSKPHRRTCATRTD